MAPRFTPHGSNIAINKSCDKQSYTLDKSIKLVPA